MKLAFSTLGCPQWEIDQILDAARSNGYDGVELRFYNGSFDLPKALAQFRGGPVEFRRRFERVGVEICCLDTSLRLAAPDQPLTEAEQMMELALALRAPHLRVFGGEPAQGESEDEWLKRMADKLTRLGRRAAQRGLRVLVETHDALSSGAKVAKLLQAAGQQGTGALWDLNHPVGTGESPVETARLIGRLTHHVHLKDGKKAGGYTLLGEGDVPLRELVAELHQAGYNRYLSLEWEKAWHPELAEPEVAFPQAARYLSELLAQLGIARA